MLDHEKVGSTEKQRFYAISRCSAMECGAVLDACKILGLIESDIYEQGKDLLKRIVAMLTRMCNF